MKNKVLVKLIVPDIDETFNVFIPVNRKIGNVLVLLVKSVKELSNGMYVGSEKTALYDRTTGDKYPVNVLVRETNIRNASKLIMM